MTTQGWNVTWGHSPPRWVCWIRSSVFIGFTVVTNRQTDHATCVATGRMFTLCIAMRPKNYSERQNWRQQFRGQHEWNKARCKRVVVAVGNCTRAMCVRARRCQWSSTESARSPPQYLYIPVCMSIGSAGRAAGRHLSPLCLTSAGFDCLPRWGWEASGRPVQ